MPAMPAMPGAGKGLQDRDSGARGAGEGRTPTPQTPQPPQTARQYIAFELGEQFYGVEITTVREIRQWTPTAELPDQPAYGRGVLDIRGEIIAVYDLRARLGGPITKVTETHMVLILMIAGRSFGILVDAVTEIISIRPDVLRPLPEGAAHVEPGTITNLAPHQDKMIAILNCSALFEGHIR